MNADTKELIESAILALLVLAFGLGTFFLAKWKAPIEVLTIFAGLSGTALGALGMKMKASSNGNGNGNGTPAIPKA